jgi:hypothetical protein
VVERQRSRLGALGPWIPAILWMLVIFAGSSVPGKDIPSGYSTYGHLGEYAVLGALLLLAVRATLPGWSVVRAGLLALAMASAYGVTDELHQFFSPGRVPDPADWAADTVGAAVGIAIVGALIAWRIHSARAEKRQAQ